jgi:hypothetical protein
MIRSWLFGACLTIVVASSAVSLAEGWRWIERDSRATPTPAASLEERDAMGETGKGLATSKGSTRYAARRSAQAAVVSR